MSKVGIIAKNEYLTNVRRTGFLVFTILVPVIGLIVMLISAFVGGKAEQFISQQIEGEQKLIGVVDQYGAFSPLLPNYADYVLYPDEAAVRTALMEKAISSAMVIPEDYLKTGVVRVLSTDTTIGTMSSVDSGRTRAMLTAHLLRGKVDQELLTRLENPMQVQLVQLSQEIGEDGSPQGTGQVVGAILLPYFLGILLTMTIFTSSGYLMQSVTEEKTSRIMEVMLSSVSARQLLAGKILGMGALGLTQMLFWLCMAWLLNLGSRQLTGNSLPINADAGTMLLVLVYFILGFMVFAVLMGVSGSLGTTQQESQQISSLLSLLAALPYFFAGFMIQNPNMTLARIFSFIPFTAPTMMLLRISMVKVPAIDIILSVIITGLSVPVLLWAGAKVFRMGLLVYGKRPSLRTIWEAIREA